MSQLRVQRSPDDRTRERAVLWSTAFYRLFGATRGREELPSEVCPMSCGETSRVLDEFKPRKKPAVRYCLSQMLASGYIPDEHNVEQFRGLVGRVVPGKSPEDAMAELRETGLREYPEPSREGARPEPLVPRDGRRQPIPGPTRMRFEGQVFTATKQILIPARFEKVRRLAEPRNWTDLGPFWEGKNGQKPIEERWTVYDKKARYKKGEVLEHFVINWNTVRVQELDVLLKVTQEWDTDMIRTDYSLIHEERNELLVDEGYGEVRRMKNNPGWTCYTGEKRLKFASNLLNLLAPGVLAAFLDGIVTSFHEMFGPKPRRSTRRQ